MKLRDFLQAVNFIDNTVEVRTGNDWYSDVVAEYGRQKRYGDLPEEDEYFDREVVWIEAPDAYNLRVWIE